MSYYTTTNGACNTKLDIFEYRESGTHNAHNLGMETDPRLWSRLQEAFESIGVRTQKEMGKICGVGQTTVSRWKLGETAPNLENMIEISLATRYEVQWLYTGLGKKRVEGIDTKDDALLFLWNQQSDEQKKEILRYAQYIVDRDSNISNK